MRSQMRCMCACAHTCACESAYSRVILACDTRASEVACVHAVVLADRWCVRMFAACAPCSSGSGTPVDGSTSLTVNLSVHGSEPTGTPSARRRH
eukprot:1685102-Pleurochrysis_carterae.AAC.1